MAKYFENSNEERIEVAIYENIYPNWSYTYIMATEGREDYKEEDHSITQRISEPTYVTVRKLEEDKSKELAIRAIDLSIQSLKDECLQKIDHLEQKKQELLALTVEV